MTQSPFCSSRRKRGGGGRGEKRKEGEEKEKKEKKRGSTAFSLFHLSSLGEGADAEERKREPKTDSVPFV